MRYREKTACFTGHRNISISEKTMVKQQLLIELENLIEKGITYFGTGGALGFDTLAAQTVLSLKKEYPKIKLILVLPCKEQTRGWQETDIKIYNHILNQADMVVYISQWYYRGCMHARNRHLVNYSDICICYLTAPTGGTAYTVQYAKQKGLRIINVAVKENPNAGP